MKRYLLSIKQYSWVVLACVVLATVMGAIVAKGQPSTYQAPSILLVQEGAPGTTYPGGPSGGGTASDSLGEALNYAAEIPTRSVMQFVIKSYPEIKSRGYTADDLILDMLPSTSTTAATITLLATATRSADAVLLANDVAEGFAAYIQVQSQSHLDTLRQNLMNQISTYQQQKAAWEGKLEALPNNTVPQYAVYNNNLLDVTHTIDTLQAQLQALPATVKGDVSVIQTATLKDVTSTPKGLIIVGITAGVGLLVGILIMLLVIFLDNRLRNDEEVSERLGLAYLGALSNSNDIKESATRISGPIAREVSDIYANLHLTGVLSGPGHAPQGAALLITSPQVAEGKTALAVALATIAARGGNSVVVIDGNLRQPATHLAFGTNPAGPGLSGLLKAAGRESVDDAVLRSNVPGVWLLPAGPTMDDSTILLEQRCPEIIKQLRKKADLIIIDGPALLSSADASLLATMVDGVAVVMDSRHEKLPVMLRAKELLSSLTHTPAGIVMNRFVRSRRNRNNYYAAVYPINATAPASPVNTAPEKWTSVHMPSGNGNGNEADNGQRLEPLAAVSLVRASSPTPAGMPQPLVPSNMNVPPPPASVGKPSSPIGPNMSSLTPAPMSQQPVAPNMNVPPPPASADKTLSPLGSKSQPLVPSNMNVPPPPASADKTLSPLGPNMSSLIPAPMSQQPVAPNMNVPPPLASPNRPQPPTILGVPTSLGGPTSPPPAQNQLPARSAPPRVEITPPPSSRS